MLRLVAVIGVAGVVAPATAHSQEADPTLVDAQNCQDAWMDGRLYRPAVYANIAEPILRLETYFATTARDVDHVGTADLIECPDANRQITFQVVKRTGNSWTPIGSTARISSVKAVSTPLMTFIPGVTPGAGGRTAFNAALTKLRMPPGARLTRAAVKKRLYGVQARLTVEQAPFGKPAVTVVPRQRDLGVWTIGPRQAPRHKKVQGVAIPNIDEPMSFGSREFMRTTRALYAAYGSPITVSQYHPRVRSGRNSAAFRLLNPGVAGGGWTVTWRHPRGVKVAALLESPGSSDGFLHLRRPTRDGRVRGTYRSKPGDSPNSYAVFFTRR